MITTQTTMGTNMSVEVYILKHDLDRLTNQGTPARVFGDAESASRFRSGDTTVTKLVLPGQLDPDDLENYAKLHLDSLFMGDRIKELEDKIAAVLALLAEDAPKKTIAQQREFVATLTEMLS